MGVEPENDILDYLGFGQNMDVNLTYVVQDEMLGLANAIYAGVFYEPPYEITIPWPKHQAQ